ncbi:MAG: serine hydrolase domain-containing protein [Janthinobacterium lividum]
MDQEIADAAKLALDGAGGIGATIAVWADGAPVLSAGLGWQDAGRAVPMPADAMLQTFSISKTLFAIVALRLAEDGELDLDGAVPGCPAGVTPRRLLNHTAGMPDYGMVPAYHKAVRTTPGRAWTRAEFIARTVEASGFGPPGAFAYSNTGYMLLREAVEQASGQPMGTLLRRFVWAPLGLTRSRLAETWADARDLAPGWTAMWGGQQDEAAMYDPGWVAMRSVLAPAGEVAAVFDALRRGRLLGAASLAAMMTPVIVPGTDWLCQEKGYGLGLMVDRTSRYGVLAGHGGGGPGYSSGVLTGEVGRRIITAAALANTDAPELGRRIAAAMLETAQEA